MAKKNNKSFLIGVLVALGALLAVGGISKMVNFDTGTEDVSDSSSNGTNVSVKPSVPTSEPDETKIIPTFNPRNYSFGTFSTPANKDSSSFVYRDLKLFENEHITKIGLPVVSITDYTKVNTFTISIISQDLTSENIITSYALNIEANTYTSNNIHGWIYFDVDISVSEGQTLAFGSKTDSVVIGCTKTYLAGESYGEVTNKVCNGIAGDESDIKSLIFLDITKEV